MDSRTLSAEVAYPRAAGLMSSWTMVGGRRMHALVAAGGTGGPPVVLVHGLGVSSRYMIPTAARLAPHGPVYAPDLPGFGRSAPPPVPMTVPHLAGALLAWMDAMGLDHPVLLGNSVGCQVIAALAAYHPGRASHLVLVGPTFDPSGGGAIRQLLRVVADSPHEPRSLGRIVLGDYRRAGPVRLARMFRYALWDRIETLLPRVEMPVLVVRGAHDTLVSQAWAETVTALLPRGRLVVIPEASHAVNYAAPGPLVAAVLRFLAEADTTPNP